MMKKQLFVLTTLLFIFISSQMNSQNICDLNPGFSITKSGDQTIILEGNTLWFSDDEICWEAMTYPELSSTPREIVFFDEDEGIMTTSDNIFYVTNDGGTSWTERPFVGNGATVNTYSCYHLKQIDANGILMIDRLAEIVNVSNDRGQTWRSIDIYRGFDGTPIDIEIIDSDTWYITTFSEKSASKSSN